MDRRAFMRVAGATGAGQVVASEAAARTVRTTIAVVVTLHVKPGREEEFLRLLLPVLDAMRHEPTFVNAVLHRDQDDPARFMLYETWADREDLASVQMRRAYRGTYEARLPDLLREPRHATVWCPLRGDFGPRPRA